MSKYSDFHLEEIDAILAILIQKITNMIKAVNPRAKDSEASYTRLENVLASLEENLAYLSHLDESLNRLRELTSLAFSFAPQINQASAPCETCNPPNTYHCNYNCLWPALMKKINTLRENCLEAHSSKCEANPFANWQDKTTT